MKALCSRCRCLVESESHGVQACFDLLEDRLKAIEEATIIGTNSQIQWLLETRQLGPLVHALHGGYAVCGFDHPMLPGDWPAGHTWSPIAKDITCELCKEGRPGVVPARRSLWRKARGSDDGR